MKRKNQMPVIAMALLFAFSAAGCGSQSEEKSADAAQQLWVVENAVDAQEGYAMERPWAAADLTTPVYYMAQESARTKDQISTDRQNQQSEEIRAVWLSYLDLKPMLLTSADKSVGEKQFTENIEKAFDNIQVLGLNTVIAQVRPFGDALYESELFPWSYLAAGKEGKAPGFDPLEIMIEQAHQRGLRLEAWVNPYRIRNSATNQPMSKSNPAQAMLQSGDAIRYNGATTYDPASKKAQKLIVDGVREIVEGYEVDGIHFDDYFYPTTDAAFDAKSYQAYQKSGGKSKLADWRRDNVNDLVKAVYQAVKDVDEDVVFGISPQGNMENNYDKQFIDVKTWLTKDGYLDYICPQIYFGFQNKTCPYAETVEAWNDLIENDVKLYVGLAPYKLGLEDTYAGKGKWEWTRSGTILSRMVETAREEEHYQGFALFRYDSVFQPQSAVKADVSKELDSLKDIL